MPPVPRKKFDEFGPAATDPRPGTRPAAAAVGPVAGAVAKFADGCCGVIAVTAVVSPEPTGEMDK